MAGAVAGWVPFEWPDLWTDPALLGLLEGTAFNCLLLPETVPAVRSAAEAAGFACPANVRWQAWRELDWSSAGELAAIGDGFWPELSRKGGDSEPAGPTAAAWLDANGWLIEMARARAPQTTIWLRSELPEDPRTLRWLHYQLALTEAWAYGARRPLRLAAPHAAALRADATDGRKAWGSLMAALAWMYERDRWQSYSSFARLAIASDFTGNNEYISTETLLLAARLGIAFVPLDHARITVARLRERQALLWCDPEPIPLDLRPWVERGATLIAMPAALKRWPRGGLLDDTHPRFRVFRAGRGRLAEARTEFDDPWTLAKDAHLLMSRRHDAVRLFNAGSLQWRHVHAPGRHIVHLLNYTLRPAAHPISAQIALPVHAARLHLPGQSTRPLDLHKELGGQEAHLPPFPVYAAVEFEEEANTDADA